MADRYFRGAMSSASDAPDQGLDRGVVVLGAVMSILTRTAGATAVPDAVRVMMG